MGYALIIPTEDFSGYTGTHQVNPVNKQKPTAIAIKGADTLDNEKNQTQYHPSFTPMLTSYRGADWSIVDGSDYASIKNNGMLTAKYYASDPDTAHDVTIKVTSARFPSVSATKVVSVKANFTPAATDVVTFDFSLTRPQKGQTLLLHGYINGEDSPLVRFSAPEVGDTTDAKITDLSDKLTLVDNLDGTATVTILTDVYLHQVQFTAYHEVYPSSIKQSKKININDTVIINAADSQNSTDLMEVFYSNGLSAESDKMYQSEAYVVTTQI